VAEGYYCMPASTLAAAVGAMRDGRFTKFGRRFCSLFPARSPVGQQTWRAVGLVAAQRAPG
jgi:hypothetical protein